MWHHGVRSWRTAWGSSVPVLKWEPQPHHSLARDPLHRRFALAPALYSWDFRPKTIRSGSNCSNLAMLNACFRAHCDYRKSSFSPKMSAVPQGSLSEANAWAYADGCSRRGMCWETRRCPWYTSLGRPTSRASRMERCSVNEPRHSTMYMLG